MPASAAQCVRDGARRALELGLRTAERALDGAEAAGRRELVERALDRVEVALHRRLLRRRQLLRRRLERGRSRTSRSRSDSSASPKLPLLTSLTSLLTEPLKLLASLHTASCCDFDELLLPPLLPQPAPSTAVRTTRGTRANEFRRMTGSPRSVSAHTRRHGLDDMAVRISRTSPRSDDGASQSLRSQARTWASWST